MSGLDDFLAELRGADQHLVDNQERTDFGPAYIDVNHAYVVDVAARRVQSTQTYAVSDETVWAEIAPDGQSVEETEANTMRFVFDFSADPTVSYLTYLGDFTQVVLDVAAVEPRPFTAGSGLLSYDVPADVAASWFPAELGQMLQNAGVDPLALTAISEAEISPIPGGIEAVLDLTPLLPEAAGSFQDASIAGCLRSVSVPISFGIHDLGTTERVELPAPETLVTEPPAD